MTTTRVALVALATGLLLLILGGAQPHALAAPPGQTIPTPQPGGTTATITPDTGGTVTAPGGEVSVTFPPGSVPSDTTVVFSPLPTETVPPASTGFRFVGAVFSIDAFLPDGTPVTTFTGSFTLCVAYTDDQVTQAGGDPNNLALQTYDEDTGQWGDLPTTVDTANKQICATLDHLSFFALAARVPTRLPVTGGEEAGSSLNVWLVGGLLLLGVGAALAARGYWRRA